MNDTTQFDVNAWAQGLYDLVIHSYGYAIPFREYPLDSVEKQLKKANNHSFGNVTATWVQKNKIEPAIFADFPGTDDKARRKAWNELSKEAKKTHLEAFRKLNEGLIEDWTIEARDEFARKLKAGELPSEREVGESELEKEIMRLVAASVMEDLKARDMKKPEKGETLGFGSDRFTWEQLLERRRAKDGQTVTFKGGKTKTYNFTEEASAIVARKREERQARAAENAKLSAATEESADDLGL